MLALVAGKNFDQVFVYITVAWGDFKQGGGGQTSIFTL